MGKRTESGELTFLTKHRKRFVEDYYVLMLACLENNTFEFRVKDGTTAVFQADDGTFPTHQCQEALSLAPGAVQDQYEGVRWAFLRGGWLRPWQDREDEVPPLDEAEHLQALQGRQAAQLLQKCVSVKRGRQD